MDPNSVVGELFEKGQNTTQTTVSDVTNAVKSQILGDEKKSPVKDVSWNLPPQPVNPETVVSDDGTKEFVKDFYAPTDTLAQAPQSASDKADQDQLAKTRSELQLFQSQHKDVYYDPLFAYENKKPQEEERPAEKADRQKMEDLKTDSEKKTKNDEDIAVQIAQKGVETRVSAG